MHALNGQWKHHVRSLLKQRPVNVLGSWANMKAHPAAHFLTHAVFSTNCVMLITLYANCAI